MVIALAAFIAFLLLVASGLITAAAVGAIYAVARSSACTAGAFVLAATIAAFTGVAAWKAIIFPMRIQQQRCSGSGPVIYRSGITFRTFTV